MSNYDYTNNEFNLTFQDYLNILIPPTQTDEKNDIWVLELFDEFLINRATYLENTENKMLELATQESLEQYKTQERKPGIKLNIESREWCEKYKDKNCSICLSEFEKKEKIVKLECDHLYHDHCISEWIKYKSECPVCRKKVSTTEETI